MLIDPRTGTALMGVFGLTLTGLAMLLWWTRRTYPGFGLWASAGVLAALSLFLMSLQLQPDIPDSISRMGANATLVFATVLYLAGARRCSGRPSRSALVYGSAVVTVSGYAFFLYVVRTANVRAALMSTFIGVVLLAAARTLLRRGPTARSVGLWVTASLFALCGATNLVRAAYNWFGPPNRGLFVFGIQGALDYGAAVPMALFPIGFLLLADEVVLSDLFVAKERTRRATAEATRYRDAEAALRDSERQFRSMANAAPVMIWTSGVDKRCTYFNQGWLDFTGRPLERELGDGWTDSVHVDDVERRLTTYIDAFDRRASFHMEYRLRRHDGVYRWVLDQGVPSVNGDGVFVGYIGSAADITEHKLAVEALATINRRLIAAQEEEHARIARELHDGLCQDLANVTAGLAGLKASSAIKDPDTQRAVSDIEEETLSVYHQIRQLSHELHPHTLSLLGLAAALKAHCAELEKRQGVIVAFSTDGSVGRLSPDMEVAFFRIAQEALRNGIIHGRARHLAVTLSCTNGQLDLTVTDDGTGFDVHTARRSGSGLGLMSMNERARVFGGSLEVISNVSQGTTIRVRAASEPGVPV